MVLPHYFIKISKFSDEYKSDVDSFRPIMNPNSSSQPIVVFGCSYAYGYIFENEQTISYVLSKYSDRPIYNRAMVGWGVQHMLYQLRNDNEMLEQIKNPKYVFYVLMDYSAHFERLYYTNFLNITHDGYYFTYKLKNGELVENKPLFGLYYRSAILQHIYNKLIQKRVGYNFYIEPKRELFDFFIFHFKKINDEIKQKWGNDIKFIILTFEGTQKQFWQSELEKEGIDVVDIAETVGFTDLNDRKLGFWEPEIDGHPNGKIWELLVPKLKEMYPDL